MLPPRVVIPGIGIVFIGQGFKCLVKPPPVPNSAAVDSLRLRHPPVLHHLIEESGRDADIGGSLHAVEATWFKRENLASRALHLYPLGNAHGFRVLTQRPPISLRLSPDESKV
jgi:hypothetical protein